MIVRGVSQRAGTYGNYRRVSKLAVQANSQVRSIPATSQATALSAGIQFRLLAQQAIFIRRYECFLTDAANTGALFAIGGEFEIAISPFGLANGVVGYPLMNEIATPQALTSGAFLSPTAVVFALLEDWFDYDDVSTDQLAGIFQLQCAWVVANLTAGAKNVTLQERVTYELWDGSVG